MASPGRPARDRRSEIWERAGIARTILREQRRLGALLRALRTDRGLSQEAASEQVGIAAKHLQRVELGLANVTLGTLVAIASAYRVSLKVFFDESALAAGMRRRGAEGLPGARRRPVPATPERAPTRRR